MTPNKTPASIATAGPGDVGVVVGGKIKLLGHACHGECAVPCPWARVEELKRALASMTDDRNWHRDHEKRLRDAIWEFGLTDGPGSAARTWASSALYGEQPASEHHWHEGRGRGPVECTDPDCPPESRVNVDPPPTYGNPGTDEGGGT